MTNQCTIEVEALPDGGYRASCAFLPDAIAAAATPEEARRAVEIAIAEHVRRQEAEAVHERA